MSTENSTPDASHLTAKAPFNDHDADTLLRSSDNVDFYVHSTMLSFASPVFRDLFDLPQAPTSPTSSNGLMKRFVEMTEDCHSLDLFLRWCDARACIPREMSIPDIATVTRLTDKFQMEGVASRIGPHLYRFVDSEPLSVYAMAMCHASLTADASKANWGNTLAQHAARQLLSLPMPFEPPAHEFFRNIPAVSLEPLYDYHRMCGSSVRRAIEFEKGSWVYDIPNWPWLRECSCPCDYLTVSGPLKKTLDHKRIPSVTSIKTPVWWKGYITRLCELLERQPSAAIILQSGSCHKDALMSIITRQCQCSATGTSAVKPAEVLRAVEEFLSTLMDIIEKALNKVVLDFTK